MDRHEEHSEGYQGEGYTRPIKLIFKLRLTARTSEAVELSRPNFVEDHETQQAPIVVSPIQWVF